MPQEIKRGRYTNADEIIARIDEVLAEVKKLREAAASHNIKGRERFERFKKTGHPKRLVERDKCYELADKKTQRADRIERRYLAYLRGKLATIQTSLLPGIEGDQSIPR